MGSGVERAEQRDGSIGVLYDPDTASTDLRVECMERIVVTQPSRFISDGRNRL
jgi:hypothetical protein